MPRKAPRGAARRTGQALSHPARPVRVLPQQTARPDPEGHWVLLEPRIVVPAHTAPPRRRWIITPDGNAMNLWDAEPVPGAQCRIAHRMACCIAHSDRGSEGEFNRSSQHLVLGGVDGQASSVDGGVDWTVADEVPGRAGASAGSGTS
ncbi:DUF6083 domain-containing protein, partial [Streptomyces sp. NPDC056352]|uniref:DUF6083 domain-containing protein n=1 Tax=Streptomyces sp. NPDC056352 TaxID=3345791 RepID=UPI0035D5A43A